MPLSVLIISIGIGILFGDDIYRKGAADAEEYRYMKESSQITSAVQPWQTDNQGEFSLAKQTPKPKQHFLKVLF